MPKETKDRTEIKVTDKRIFTADGQIREEFRDEIRPGAPGNNPAPPPAPETAQAPRPVPPAEEGARPADSSRSAAREGSRPGRTMTERGESPNTPFGTFVQTLVMQAYMTLGMLRNPYQPQAKPDPAAARELIDIISMLQQKTAGNLTPDEEDFLSSHLGQLKLAYVQTTKNLS